MKVRILPEASEDLVHGYQFYENQSPGLGEYFLESLFSEIDSLETFPGVHAVRFGKHRKLAKRFPHSIYYLIEANEILIYAVVDDRRDPQGISDRLN